MDRKSQFEKTLVPSSSKGRPNRLKDLVLLPPQIWTNSFDCQKVIKFLYQQGRHVYVHQTRKEQKQLKSDRKCYEIAQNVAYQLFNIYNFEPRLIVFFFRQPDETIVDFQKINTQQLSQKFVNILQQTSFLFNKQFLEEWIFITMIQGKDLFKVLFKDKYCAQQYPQIIQNTYIQHILNDMLTNHNVVKYTEDTKELENNFLQFVNLPSTKEKVINFIQQLLEICEQNIINHQPDSQDLEMSKELDNQIGGTIYENSVQQSQQSDCTQY